jgi:hypothetical protein
MARNPPFSIRFGDLVSKTLSAYFRNLAPFTVLAVLVFAPWIACVFLFPDPPVRSAGMEQTWRRIGMFLLQTLLSYVLIGAVTFGVVQQMRGEPQSFGTSIAMGLRSFFGALGTGMLCGLRILVGFILLYVPGIIESIRLYVAIPIAIIEGIGGSRAVQRSIDLTAGSRWPIFGAVLLMVVVTVGLGAIGGFVIGTTLDADSLALQWLEVVIAVVTSTFSATLAAVCYALLRHGKENVDVKDLAAVFA